MFLVNIDIKALGQFGADIEATMKKAAEEAARQLVPAVHAHILEQAQQKLHSRLKMFTDGLSMQQEGEHTWVITLDRKARWIDDGMESHEMIDDLLAKGKTAKDGSKYRVIPFHHGPGKGKTSTTPAQQTLIATIKQELKSRGIPFGKIERGADGKPLQGLLHKLDINGAPVKTQNGPGQGWGRIGDVRQGFTGIPFLQGVRIYQKSKTNKDGSEGPVQRAIMTFRVVSSKHKGTGRWVHPGLEPVHIIDEAYDWAQHEWETNILPKIVDFISKQG